MNDKNKTEFNANDSCEGAPGYFDSNSGRWVPTGPLTDRSETFGIRDGFLGRVPFKFSYEDCDEFLKKVLQMDGRTAPENLDLLIASCAVLVTDFSTDEERRGFVIDYLVLNLQFYSGIYRRSLNGVHHDLSDAIGLPAKAELDSLIDFFCGLTKKVA